MLAFTAFPRARRAQADFIPEESATFKSAVKKLGLQVSERKTGFLLQGEDRVGALIERQPFAINALARAPVAGIAIAKDRAPRRNDASGIEDRQRRRSVVEFFACEGSATGRRFSFRRRNDGR